MKVLNYGSLNIDHVYQVDQIVQPGQTIDSFGVNVFPGQIEAGLLRVPEVAPHYQIVLESTLPPGANALHAALIAGGIISSSPLTSIRIA